MGGHGARRALEPGVQPGAADRRVVAFRAQGRGQLIRARRIPEGIRPFGFRSGRVATISVALLNPRGGLEIAHDLEATVPAKFTLTKDAAGKFRFALLAANGAVVAQSTAYGTKASALSGLASVRQNAAGAILDDTTTATGAPKALAKAAAKPSVSRLAPRAAAAKKPVTVKAAVKPAAPKAVAPKAVTKVAVKPAAPKATAPKATVPKATA